MGNEVRDASVDEEAGVINVGGDAVGGRAAASLPATDNFEEDELEEEFVEEPSFDATESTELELAVQVLTKIRQDYQHDGHTVRT